MLDGRDGHTVRTLATHPEATTGGFPYLQGVTLSPDRSSGFLLPGRRLRPGHDLSGARRRAPLGRGDPDRGVPGGEPRRPQAGLRRPAAAPPAGPERIGGERHCQNAVVVRDLQTGAERTWRYPDTPDYATPLYQDAVVSEIDWAPDSTRLAYTLSYEGDSVSVLDTEAAADLRPDPRGRDPRRRRQLQPPRLATGQRPPRRVQHPLRVLLRRQLHRPAPGAAGRRRPPPGHAAAPGRAAGHRPRLRRQRRPPALRRRGPPLPPQRSAGARRARRRASPPPTGERRAVTRTALRICPLCEAGCGLEVGLSATDEVVRIRGDRNDVWSAGYLCPKGPALKHLHEDPDRLRRPVVRRDGRLVEVGWDEAFSEAGRLLGGVVAASRAGGAGPCIWGTPTPTTSTPGCSSSRSSRRSAPATSSPPAPSTSGPRRSPRRCCSARR